MAAELPRPGVEVIQVFRTVSPTVVTPTLVPVVVGACKQVVDVLVPSASGSNQLNSAAAISLPGGFIASAGTGDPVTYTGLDGLILALSINNGPVVSVTFAGASLSPSSVVAQILAAFLAAGVTEASAETYGEDTFRVFTVGDGEFQSLLIDSTTSGTVLTTFGLKSGESFVGSTAYAQDIQTITLADFPDPNNNIDEIAVEASTVRAFLALGSGSNLREFSKTSAFLRKGGSGTSAVVVGTEDLTSLTYGPGGDLDGLTLIVAIDGATAVTITLGTPTTLAHFLQTINVALGAMIATSVTELQLASTTKGPLSSVAITGGTAVTALGLTLATTVGVAGVVVADDGNGDALSPLVSLVGEDFSDTPDSAVALGIADLTALTLPGDVVGETLVLAVSGKPPQTVVFTSASSTPANLVGEINALFGDDLTASVNGVVLQLETQVDGTDAAIEIIGGTAVGILGLVPRLVGTISFANIEPDPTALNSKKLHVVTETGAAEVTFSGFTGGTTLANVVTFLNADIAFALVALADISGTSLRISSKKGGLVGGSPAFVDVLPASSAEGAQYLGFNLSVPATYQRFDGAVPCKPLSGDDLYVDGGLVGRITKVVVGGDVTVLKLDKQLTIASDAGSYWWISANNLSTGTAGRPEPEIVIVGTGVPTLKQDVLRDTNGVPLLTGKAVVYLAYRALRLDVSPRAQSPGLQRFNDTTDVTNRISPVSAENPLALGVYFALLNAPGAVVSALGIDAITADAPFGTVEAFTRAAEYLEAFEVYSIAPLTHDETVGQVFNTHVTAMSEPAAKGERICLFNFSAPSKRLDKLVASGLDGNTLGSTGLSFDTGVQNLSALLLAQGVNPVGTLATGLGVFLDIASDAKHYSISAVAGSVITLRKVFSSGENDDGFYSTTDLNDSPLTAQLISEPFSVKVRGAALTNTDGSPDKAGIAETYQALAMSYGNRRFRSFVPDQCAATLNGLEQVIDGFYMCAARAGMMAQNPPQQSFTNFPMTGFTRVLGSSGYFTEKQLNIIAAGGNDIIVQDAQGAPVISRFALTTDMTSIETRTDSINSVVDFTAKFLRRGVKSYIGRFNITQGFLDSLSHVLQGLLDFLKDLGVLVGASLNNLIQDENAPDTVLVDVTLDVPYPCNFIRITLVI